MLFGDVVVSSLANPKELLSHPPHNNGSNLGKVFCALTPCKQA